MKSSRTVIPRGRIVASRSMVFPVNCSKDTACVARSRTQQSSDSQRSVAASQRTMKLLSLSVKHARTSWREIATEKVREHQQARLAPNERHALQDLHGDSLERTPGVLHETSRAAESLQYAKEH